MSSPQMFPGIGKPQMKDIKAHLEKLRIEAEECELISKLATSAIKKELFARLASHHRTLAEEVERAIRKSDAPS